MPKSLLALVFSLIFVGVQAQNLTYDENLVRYKLWPMAAASNSPHPELCIADTFKNASVRMRSNQTFFKEGIKNKLLVKTPNNHFL